MRKCLFLLLLCAPLFGTEIVLWHAFEGFLAEKFTEIVDDFNHSSGIYQVKLVYKGNYKETFDRGMEACKTNEQPHILQVYEVATQTMMLKPETWVPVDDLLRTYYKKFDSAVYIDTVRDFYSTFEGKMVSLPWNASTGILFYNKTLFAKAGLDPNTPPKTWIELESMGKKLVKSGYKGFTTAWPAAYHLEHLCCWHNLPFATHDNGFGGLQARLNFCGPYQLRHLEKLVKWQKNGIFTYQGRMVDLPEKTFASGQCGILLQGANRLPTLKRLTSDEIGVGFMPYWPDICGAPYRLNIGGSSFWALAGFDEEISRGVAHFLAYLSLPEIQAYWHQTTGYLPITESAYYLTKKKGFYEKNQAAEIAVLEVMQGQTTPHTKGIRLGNYPIIREKIIDHLEKAFNGELKPKEALEKAIVEGNLLLEKFEKEHSSSSVSR